MAIRDVFKVSFRTVFNPRAWLGYDQLKDQTKTLWDIIKSLITPAKPERQETFEEAMQRFGVTETDVKQRGQAFLAYTWIFLSLGASSFLAGFYLLFHHKTISGWLLAIAVTTLFLSQAFRFHFWYFQIKHRKLGCTWQEWRRGKINPPEENEK